METLSEHLRQVSDRVAAQGVDIGLGAVMDAVEREDVPSRAIATAGELLGQRAAALKAARDSVKRLRRWVDYTAAILPFTADGWPERRAELEARLEAEPVAGLEAWLADAYRALSEGRRDAVERLATIALPSGAEILADRFLTAVAGIDERRWHLTAPIALPAAGTRAGDRCVAGEGVRDQLRALMLRLAIAAGLPAEADRLEANMASGRGRPTLNALRARRQRLAGDIDGARSAIAAATRDAPADLDVAIERIAVARSDDLEDLALDAAQVAVAALPALSDVESAFARLVTDLPAELWVAVADRALAEGETGIHERAVRAAEAAADSGPLWLRALVAEMEVRSAGARHALASEQAALLVWAGSCRVSAGHVDVAIEHFNRARHLEPANADAALRLADAKVQVATALPLPKGRELLESALRIIGDVHDDGPLAGSLSWSFLTEAYAHGLLAKAADARSLAHRWRSLLAACRGVAHEPEDAARWVEFADRTDQLGMFRVAEAAAARAYELDPDSDGSISQRIQSLVNSGDFESALELLRGHTEPWDEAVRGYILARAGKPLSAVDVLRTAGADPTWFWASHTLMIALLLTDRRDEAFGEARMTRRVWRDRGDEIDGKLASAWSALILGDFDTAATTAAEVKDVEPEGQAAVLHGCALLLTGDTDGGLTALAAVLSRTRILALLYEWQSMICPALQVLAAHYRITLPSLEALDARVADRRQALERRVDPVEELRQAHVPAGDVAPVRLAKDMGVALLQIAVGDLEDARATVAASLRAHPGDPELAALRRYLDALAVAATPAETDAVATTFADVLAHGPAAGAVAILRGLLDAGSDQWAQLISRAVGDGADVDGVLVRLGADPRYSDRVAAVRRVLAGTAGDDGPAEPMTADRRIRVLLPPSWFDKDKHPDPVHDHPLFIRHLPEIRARATFTVPGVNVTTDEELEPDGYRILVNDEVAEEGRVDPSVVYVAPAAVPLLGSQVQGSVAHVEELGLASVPQDVARESEDLTGLLTMTAVEVIARRIADVARAGAARVLEAPAPRL